MGRIRSFDKQEAIEQALKIFWQVGYERASLEDLLAAMGIKNSSFYQAFSSKENLFLEVVRNYRQSLGAERLAILDNQDLSVAEILQVYYKHLIYRASRLGYPVGCFMTLTAASLTDPHSVIGEAVTQSMNKIHASFQKVIQRGIDSGEISKTMDVKRTALMCVTVSYGITVMGRTQKSKKDIFEAAASLITLLTGKNSKE